MQKVIIFGTGELAQRIFYYLKDSDDEVVAFSANRSNIDSNELLGLPVIAFENIKEKYPPGEFSIFIALAYSEMNRKRTKFFDEAKIDLRIIDGKLMLSNSALISNKIGKTFLFNLNLCCVISWSCLILFLD